MILAFSWTSAAFGHPEYLWPERPALTAAETSRIDALVAEARAEFPRLAPDERRSWTNQIAVELTELGFCRRAEQLLESVLGPDAPVGSGLAVPAAGGADPACADRFITRMAALRDASGQVRPTELYLAGALWRRIGERDKGAEAIARAEAIYQQEEARDPDAAWTCHGGNCVSPLWSTRLYALRMYHGTPLHRLEMNWLTSLALEHWDAREAHRPAPLIGQYVFEELLFHTVNEGYEPLSRALAENTVYRAASYPTMRMRMLLRRGMVAEAMARWPEAGRAFSGPFEPALILDNPAAFHPYRDRFRLWMGWHETSAPLSVLPIAWLEAGDRTRAREALASADADLAAHADEWHADQIGRIRAAEAQLESPGDPLARLAAGPPADALTRDFALAELAAGLAAAGRAQDASRALRLISSPGIAYHAAVRLPCRAAAGGEAAALMAVRIAAPSLRPLALPGSEASQFDGDSYQSFLCLFRRRQPDAALAYAAAVRDPEHKLALLTAMPLNGGVDDNFSPVAMPPGSRLADELPVRRRFATLALEHVRRHDLWNRSAVAQIAADFERLGEFGTVDAILRRVRDDETKGEVYRALLRSHGRDRIRPRPQS